MARKLVALFVVCVFSVLALEASAKVKVVSGSPRIAQPSTPAVGDDNPQERWVATKAILRDAQTGQLRKPTAAETRELVATLRQLTARPTFAPRRVISADGKIGATAQAAAPQVLIARATSDGQNETLCVSTFAEAAAFLGLEKVSDQ